MARVIFLNRFYWPEEPATAQLLTDLAEALAARGHAVTIITSQPATPGPRQETRAGVRIERVRGTRWGRRRLAGRAVDFATFVTGASWRLLRTAQAGDIVVALTDPPFLGVAVWLVARWRGARCLHWVQDIFPEIALALTPNAVGRTFGSVLRLGRNLAWRHSDGCVTVGHDMAALITRAGLPPEKISIISNWAPDGLEPLPPEAATALRQSWGLAGRFLVVYSGNLGRVHDLAPVLEVAFALRHENRLAFVFIGDGAQRAGLEEAARARGLANVYFHPPQPRARLGETLALGDVHLVTVRAGCEALVFPSKLYGIAAVGRPVLFMGPRDCEVARIVTQCGFGLAYTRDEVAGISHGLQALVGNPDRCALLGARAAEFSRAAGRLEHALAAWEQRLAREAAC